MNNIIKLISSLLLGAMLLIGCDKADDLPYYENGIEPSITVSANTIAPVPSDSLETGLVVNWTNPGYAADTAGFKYVIEIDQVGNNFSKANQRVLTGALSTSYLNKELNTFLLDRGFEFNTPYDMELRVISSYPNNNERRFSNVLPIRMTPYKVPPKVALPESGRLFLVGSATQGDWTNPVSVPTQEFSRISETVFAGVFDLKANGEYLVLPMNGLWDQKYSVANKGLSGLSAGGDFGFGLNDNIPGPATAGLYKIELDFQSGKFVVTPFADAELPSALFMVGNATPGQWNNPVPVPSQQFTRLNSVEYELTLELNGNSEYLLLPENGNWNKKYAVANNTLPGLREGGVMGFNLASNIPGPVNSGTYKIKVNFATHSYLVTPL
ncbi:SusE domain-containing protein [Flavihumibacter sp. UBA7668]|uniref:SusE domain-containing protein n=1 Tax=Flavihumibacter sp. UBA7668 TaxID=1946542 RepID=UPI0025BBB120|nr:SusE domain-containing protein [Flavihumibacter sp. UBA7668]